MWAKMDLITPTGCPKKNKKIDNKNLNNLWSPEII